MSINIISYNTIFPYYGDGTYESPYVWDYYTGNQEIEFTCNQRGKVYIGGINYNILDRYNPYGQYNNYITKVGNPIEKLEDGPFLKFYSNSNSSSTYRIFPQSLTVNNVLFEGEFNPLSIWFEPESETTTSDPVTTTTTTSGPVTTTTTTPEPTVFIHVGNITVSDDYCGRYKLTSTGDTDYLRVYGKRIYLVKYPETPGTYDLTVCAADLANRFTPVCDTFSLDIDYCEFTTSPPTTTTTNLPQTTTTLSPTTTTLLPTTTTTTTSITTSTTSTTAEGSTTTSTTTTSVPTTTSTTTTSGPLYYCYQNEWYSDPNYNNGTPFQCGRSCSTSIQVNPPCPFDGPYSSEYACVFDCYACSYNENACTFNAEQDSGGSWYWVKVSDNCGTIQNPYDPSETVDCICPTPVFLPDGSTLTITFDCQKISYGLNPLP